MPLVVDSTGNDLTYKLIGLAMEVHNELGHGFKEEAYYENLGFEFVEPTQAQVAVLEAVIQRYEFHRVTQ